MTTSPFGFGRPSAQTAREIEDVTFEDITDNQEPRNDDDSGTAKARRRQIVAAAVEFCAREMDGKHADHQFNLIVGLNFIAGARWAYDNPVQNHPG